VCVYVRVRVCACVCVRARMCACVRMYTYNRQPREIQRQMYRMPFIPKLHVIFRKRTTNYRAHLQKMTYKDKVSYEFRIIHVCMYTNTHTHVYARTHTDIQTRGTDTGTDTDTDTDRGKRTGTDTYIDTGKRTDTDTDIDADTDMFVCV